MWDVFGKTDLFLLTTNPIIRKDGAIVMGRGIAKEAAIRFPDLPFTMAIRYKQNKHEQQYVDPLNTYNVGFVNRYEGQLIGWFMVKDHWKEAAKLEIIEQSVRELIRIANWQNTGNRLLSRIDLNFPGIGNGKLKREDVLPIIQQLPDNVHVWEYG